MGYVVEELQGRLLELEEGINQQLAKKRESELNLERVKKSTAEMIDHYEGKMREIREALAVLTMSERADSTDV